MRAKTLTALAIATGAAAFFLRGGVNTPIATSSAAPTAANPLDDIIQRRGLTADEARAFGCSVSFGQARNTLRFPDATLAGAPAGANPTIAEQIRKFTAVLLDRVAARSVQGRVACRRDPLLLVALQGRVG
jgi:hypothetical protein